MSNRNIISIFGVVILVVLSGFFLLDIQRSGLHYFALLALVFSLFFCLYAILLICNNQMNNTRVFFSAALGAATFIYLAAVIASLVLVNNFADKVSSFVFLQLIINALFVIVNIIIIASSKYVQKKQAIASENLENEEYNKPNRGDF